MGTSNRSSSRAAGKPADGHRRVQIAYSADQPDTVGTVVDLPADEARTKVREGRARYVDDATPVGEQKDTDGGGGDSPAGV